MRQPIYIASSPAPISNNFARGSWETNYVHPLDGPKGIVEWFEGSALRPFLDPLSPGEREAFLARYEKELAAAYPRQSNGKVLLRYPRADAVR